MNWVGFWATLAAFAVVATFVSLVGLIRADIDQEDPSFTTTSLIVSFLVAAMCAAFAALFS